MAVRILYWLSWIPTAPFFALSWVAYGIAWVLTFIGEIIHDETTWRLWRILHKRECDKIFGRGKP